MALSGGGAWRSRRWRYLLYVHGPFSGASRSSRREPADLAETTSRRSTLRNNSPRRTRPKSGGAMTGRLELAVIAVARFVEFDAGRPFYSAAAGLTPTQEALHRVRGRRRLTRRGSTVSKILGSYDTRRAEQVPRQAQDASRPRTYNSPFVPSFPRAEILRRARELHQVRGSSGGPSTGPLGGRVRPAGRTAPASSPHGLRAPPGRGFSGESSSRRGEEGARRHTGRR